MSVFSRAGRRLLLSALLPALIGIMFFASAPAQAAGTGTATDVAARQIGDPYRYGAAGPNAFDCSGLTYFSYRKAGFKRMPRTSSAQARFTHRIRKAKMRRGDLMFFSSGSGVYHVSIFLGWRKGRAYMLHSPRSGERVKRQVAWTSSWYGGTLRRR